MVFARGNRKFAAVDRAIARDGLKFTLLLRLSPLLPFAASNYLYGGWRSRRAWNHVLIACLDVTSGVLAANTCMHALPSAVYAYVQDRK
jgi:uncharacterized membrane protein YdjX (TVP38/TMEM64 family)